MKDKEQRAVRGIQVPLTPSLPESSSEGSVCEGQLLGRSFPHFGYTS